MAQFNTTVDIQAQPEQVWAVMRDVEHWPEWTASITSIEFLNGERLNKEDVNGNGVTTRGPLAVGSRVRIRQPKFPPAVWQVTGLEEGKSFTWVSRGPGIMVTAHHSIERNRAMEHDQGGSRVSLSLRYTGIVGRLLALLTKGITERYMAMEARGLKARSEAGAGPGRPLSSATFL